MIHPVYFIFLFLLFACGQDDSGKSGLSNFESTASFHLVGDGYDEVTSFNSNDNLIFSQLFENNEMWIRLAASQNANGEHGSHIDIDICDYSGSAKYAPIDPQKRPCSKSGWDIWWHDDSKVYFNQETSNPCILILTQNGDMLSGVFECDDVIKMGGTSTIQIKDGSFKTMIERK
ncbi:hypothetical protein SAMN05421640_2740 [Ekhidna lutea]|uniref:Uncharacterized protein n=1 Tax=Ekhidna lutea TaxID=447679 RepID=A0A239KKD4_EKHLU|nr:hypothetical protein [Ekhidna lutea]SNT18837.1 hypothetical protein SAMN05421640_2740 [Ekhidna lutea]